MAFAVKITDPSGNAYEVQLRDGDTSIGRDPSNTLVLSGRGVSRKHAKLVVEGERLTLVDLGSTYGTRVNEMPTLRREIKLGDRLTVGMHQLEVCQPSK